ncbi:MAG: O-antigen ligase family protein [Oscillospiraceae bacterium]|nr:O-antigen ligase family protein [Oscillospiraceae bacterium]
MSTQLDTATPVQNGVLANLRVHPVCIAIDRFLRTPWYFVMVGQLALLSSTFALELITYTCYILIAIFIVLLGKDFLPLTPLIVLCYISPSIANNPGLNSNSVFSGISGIYLLCIASIFLLCLIIRLCTDGQIGQRAFLFCERRLLSGMLLLGAAYILAGAFSSNYTANGFRNALFGLIQFGSVFLFYFLFTGTIRWKDVSKNYLAWAGLCIGGVIFFQIAHIYLFNGVLVDWQIDRNAIYSGWGNCNNIGTMLAITIPFVFQLACTQKRPWVYEIIALLFLGGVVLTCSRGSILAAAITYALSSAVLIYKDLRRKNGRITRLIILAALIPLAVVFFHKELVYFFESLISRGWDPSQRDEIYMEGIKQFFRFPVFGGSFYPSDYVPFEFSSVQEFSAFFPPRWHNTFVQMLASCGIVGLGAYIYHRYQTVKLLLKKPSFGKGFIGLSILVLLGASLVDCHFFNVGPTMFYSVALAFAEKADTRLAI